LLQHPPGVEQVEQRERPGHIEALRTQQVRLGLLDARRVLEQSADRAEDAAGRLELALAQAEIWR